MPEHDNNKQPVNPLHVVVYCGPNGSGKTSMMNILKEQGLPLNGAKVFPPIDEVNPDVVAKTMSHPAHFSAKQRDEAAQKQAWAMREGFLAERKPFSFETVMSHPSRLNELQRLKEANYSVYVTFITTNDPEKNVERVKQRVASNTTTGHDVPVDKIRSRYERTLELLPKAVEIADASYVYDNSYDRVSPTLQAAIEGDEIRLAEPLEPWVKTRLLEPLEHRGQEMDALEREIEKRGFKLELPNELAGEYIGTIAFETAYYLAVYDGNKTLSIHDKLMLNTMTKQKYVVDTPCLITYDYNTEPRIELRPARLKLQVEPNLDVGSER
ncbi:zeta toxin family protein [Massilia sp. HP4]|uniref:zeta toxin family protein n=1 Tax=Massilia sp. HP4 TaxID=2562316 RepID=UPI0010C03A4F|nr:zeta toxin family protein [Massilia sp. HP4]